MNADPARVTVGDLNASFRGDVYGDPSNDAAWFDDHVARNDVDLARSRRWTVDGTLSGMMLLALRGDRAWIGGFGVVPEFRRRGLAGRYLDETLAIARDAGASSVELEVLERNASAIALYERGGFTTIGNLVAWTRSPAASGGKGKTDTRERTAEAAGGRGLGEVRAYAAHEVARIARTPSTCWQREPCGVAAASPLECIVIGDGRDSDAYAFVRRGAGRVSLVDAGARDVAGAQALLRALDARRSQPNLMLVNEPPHGALHDALVAHPGWSELVRQRRMRIALR